MKKMITIVLTVLMVLSLAGCKRELPTTATKKQETKAKTIKDLKPEKGASLILWTKKKEYGEGLAKAFTAKYNIPVKVEEVGLETIKKISLDGPTGKGADVFQCAHDAFPQGVQAGLFRKLDQVVADNVRKNVSEVAVKTCSKGNDLYGVPVSMECMCLFYNKDLVGDKPATTLEQIMEEAKTFNNKDKNQFELLWKPGDGYQASPILSVGGFQLFGKDGTDEKNPGFDTDEFEKGLELLSRLHESIPISSTDLSNGSFFKKQLADGKTPYIVDGPWDINELKQKKVNFGVAMLPTYEGKQMTSFAGVQNMHISAYTKYPIASELLISFAGSEEGAKILNDTTKEIPTLKDVSKVNGLNEDDNVQNVIKQFNNSIPMPSVKNISVYWDVAESVGKAVFDGKITPAEGRKKAMKDWKAAIETGE
ncbi:maltose/maltodextrin ABC transporter, substrate binding periplasmic protein MalE [Lachnospiraceae bacterium KM106-2]|nr:maltose/maltodextrin ABC transporter, substrate binding periplasmic protein MalE [Lachnospiraceae bacterium KM106-2]